MLPRLTCRTLPFGLLAAGVLAIAVNASANVKGRAYGCWANMPNEGISNVTNCDTGWLDSQRGGSRSSYKSNVQYGNTLRIDTMENETRGNGCTGHSGSKLEGGYIMKGKPGEVTWVHMESDDDDTCCRHHDDDGYDARARIVGLTFNGKPVVVTGRANQTLTIPGVATLVLNEHAHGHDDDCHEHDDGEHRAMHWYGNNGQEVILGCSKFRSDDHCCAALPVHHSTWGSLKQSYR